MPTERVLIEIVTAANMAGVEAAQAGFLGFTPQVLLAGAALAGLVFVGKSAIENFEAQQKATVDLTQAYATQHDTLAAHQKEIGAFLETNKRFISDQYDTQAALAQVVRAGHNEADAIRILNDALDLSAVRHIAVSEAANMLVLAEAGNSRGLRFLGITTTEYNAIMKSKLSLQEKDAALLALVETKTKDGRKATTELQQTQNALNKDWQDFSSRIGPPVVGALAAILTEADKDVQELQQLADVAENILGLAGQHPSRQPLPQASVVLGHGRFGPGATHASGLSYVPYDNYPALLHQGEQVVPAGEASGARSGGVVVNVHIDGFYSDGPGIDRFANRLAQRLSYVTGR